MKRNLIVFAAMFFALNVFAQSELEEFDVFDLDEVGELKVPPILEQQEIEHTKPEERECLCQCLTRGLKAQNKKSWKGSFVGPHCVCPCLIKK